MAAILVSVFFTTAYWACPPRVERSRFIRAPVRPRHSVSTPTLELVISEAANVGADQVLIVNGPGKPAIAEYFEKDPDLESALAGKGDHDSIELINRATELAQISFIEQKEPKGLGHAIGHGEQFADGEPFAVLLPDDLVDERDELLGPMLDVQAEHGGVVIALLDVGPVEIEKYGCVVPAEGADTDADVVPIAQLVEKPKADEAPSTLAIIGRYVLPPEIFDAWR